MTTPVWQAPINGARNQLNAVDASAHFNQFLSTHPSTELGYGNVIVAPVTGDQGYFTHGGQAPAVALSDFAQAFTMSGTTIGRITVPVLAFGNGADALFSLCPDSGGNPNLSAPICQVKMPASVLATVGAENGLENASGVFQLAYNNTQFGTNFAPTTPWISPAATVHGAPGFFALATSQNYSLLLGGFDSVGGNASALCFTSLYTGAGTVAAPIPQPSLPQATFQGTAMVTPDTVVYAGGTTTSPIASSVSSVWTASWDPSNGIIGAWSSQTALPVALTNGTGASFGEFVYFIGGNTANTVASTVNTVYVNKVTNSQLGSWTALTPLPVGLMLPFVAVVGNWMVVAGGLDATNTNRTETYYAAIMTDGSLGPWQKGPALHQAVNSFAPNWNTGITSSSIIAYSGSTASGNGTFVQQLSVDPTGIAPSWNVFSADSPGVRAMSAFTDGNGIWYLLGYNINNTAQQNFFQPVPVLSLPLYATGLTNGSQYWLVVQEVQNQNNSDFIGVGLNFGAYAGSAKTSLRHQNSWSNYLTGYSIPLTVYDATPSVPTIHVVEDLSTTTPGNATYQRWSTLAYGQNKMLSGAIEVVMQPNLALNSNPTFTSGTSPWTTTNGTLTQSNAQTHGGFPFSGLLTPTGGSTSSANSELFPAQQTSYGDTAWFLATGWFFSTTGWSTFSLSVNWYDSGSNLLSTSSAVIALTANTWTQVSNYFTPPVSAAFGQLMPIMTGNPTGANLLYINNTFMVLAPENVGALTSIAQVNYQTGTLWPPVGVTQLN